MIMRCSSYDPGGIAAVVQKGMEELSVIPRGKIMVKPNCVIAHKELFPYAFTAAEFLDGVLRAVKAKGRNVQEVSVGERSGITVPTRFCFKNAGYYPVIRKHGVRAYHFEEWRQIPIRLKSKHALRDVIFVPEPVARCDFLINLPKFKAHPWTRLTLSLKNFIGIQDDRHRLVDHNSFLEHKIADLQEAVQPRFIAVDAIIAGQKMMLTPEPFPIGAIIMGTNQCAVDTVCCHMVHLDPNELVHLRLAAEKGFGPMDLSDIDISGDFPLDEVREKCRDFKFCWERIDSYFGQDSNIRCTVGSFPEEHAKDYCWGGCPGALQEAIHIFEVFKPGVTSRLKKIRYVVGKVDQPLELADGERALFAGDCTSWQGTLNGEEVVISADYRSREEVDVTRTKSNDMLLNILGQLWHCFRKRKSRYLRAKGCPVSVAAHVNYLSTLGNIENVNFDRRVLFSINIAYWRMRAAKFWNRFFS